MMRRGTRPAPPAPGRRRAVAAVSLILATMTLGCGYSLVGRGAFIPEYIQTVAIPTFENSTQRFEVEIRITDAVSREFVSRGNYRVVSDPQNADAVLRGEILSFTARPVGLGAEQREARTFQVQVRSSVTFTDQVENKVLFANRSFLFSDEFEFPEDPNSLFDVETGAIDEIAREFARSVVSSILEAF